MTIREIQDWLNQHGFKGANGQPLTVDGISGTNTKYAIKAYQTANGLQVDGIAGPITQGKMQSNTSSGSTSSDSSGSSSSSSSSSTTNGSTSTNGGTTSPNTGFMEDYSKAGDTRSSIYGAAGRNSDWEGPAVSEEASIAKAAGDTNIVSPNFLKTLSADPSIVGFYVNALAYGGYTMGDILNDMKRRELISQGNTEAKNLRIIDADMNRTTYQSTAEGQKSIQDTSKIIPTFNLQGLLNPEILKYGANIPDQLFKTLVPIMDKNSQEFKDAVAKVKAGYYDLATATLKATTEQEKAVADYNLKNFTEQINKQYGIALSDDATKAWGQIQDLENNTNQRGIAGSGIENEGVDNLLATTRKQDQRLRDEKLTKEEQQKAAYYTSSASAAEINKLTPEEKKKYGLSPSSEILSKFSISALKAQYPNKSDSEIKAMHDAVLDENGNYRSSLYSKYFTQAAQTEITNSTNAEKQVLLDAANREDKAYRNYDQSQPFSQATPDDNTQMANDAASSTQTTSNTTDTSNQTSSNQTNPGAGTSSSSGTSTWSIKQIQDYLNSKGYKGANGQPLTVDGISGTNTKYAIKAYQTAMGLKVDGIAGPITQGKMQGTGAAAPTAPNTGTTPNTATATTQKAPDDPSNQYRTDTGAVNTKYNSTYKAPTSTYTPPTNTYKPPTSTPPIYNKPPTPTPTPVYTPPTQTPAKTGYQGYSIVDYLSSVGKDTSYASRKALSGSGSYAGTASENAALLKKLRGY